MHKKNTALLWDCPPSAFLVSQDVVNNGAHASCVFVLAPALPPYVTGDLYSFAMTCSGEASSSSIQILPLGDPVAGTSGALFTDFHTNQLIVRS